MSINVFGGGHLGFFKLLNNDCPQHVRPECGAPSMNNQQRKKPHVAIPGLVKIPSFNAGLLGVITRFNAIIILRFLLEGT